MFMATRNALSATRLLMIAVKEKPATQIKSRNSKAGMARDNHSGLSANGDALIANHVDVVTSG